MFVMECKSGLQKDKTKKMGHVSLEKLSRPLDRKVDRINQHGRTCDSKWETRKREYLFEDYGITRAAVLFLSKEQHKFLQRMMSIKFWQPQQQGKKKTNTIEMIHSMNSMRVMTIRQIR